MAPEDEEKEEEARALLEYEERYLSLCIRTETDPRKTCKQALKYLDIAISSRTRVDALRQEMKEEGVEKKEARSNEKGELLYHRASLLLKCGFFEEAESLINDLHTEGEPAKKHTAGDSPVSTGPDCQTNVVLVGLQSEHGQTLNGKPGHLNGEAPGGRFAVSLEREEGTSEDKKKGKKGRRKGKKDGEDTSLSASLSPPQSFHLRNLAFFSTPQHRSLSLALQVIDIMRSTGHGTDVARAKEVRASRGAFAKSKNRTMTLASSPLAREARKQATARLQNVKQTLREIKVASHAEHRSSQYYSFSVALCSDPSSSSFSGASRLLASSLTRLSASSHIPFELYLHSLCKEGLTEWPRNIPRTHIFGVPARSTQSAAGTQTPGESAGALSDDQSEASLPSDDGDLGSDHRSDSDREYEKKVRSAIPTLIRHRKKEERRREKAARTEGGVNALPFPRPRYIPKPPPPPKSHDHPPVDLNTLPFPLHSLGVSDPYDLRKEMQSDERQFNFSLDPPADGPPPLEDLDIRQQAESFLPSLAFADEPRWVFSLDPPTDTAPPLEDLEIRRQAAAFLPSLCRSIEPLWNFSLPEGQRESVPLPVDVVKKDATLPAQERVLEARARFRKKRGAPFGTPEECLQKVLLLAEKAYRRIAALAQARTEYWDDFLEHQIPKGLMEMHKRCLHTCFLAAGSGLWCCSEETTETRSLQAQPLYLAVPNRRLSFSEWKERLQSVVARWNSHLFCSQQRKQEEYLSTAERKFNAAVFTRWLCTKARSKSFDLSKVLECFNAKREKQRKLSEVPRDYLRCLNCSKCFKVARKLLYLRRRAELRQQTSVDKARTAKALPRVLQQAEAFLVPAQQHLKGEGEGGSVESPASRGKGVSSSNDKEEPPHASAMKQPGSPRELQKSTESTTAASQGSVQKAAATGDVQWSRSVTGTLSEMDSLRDPLLPSLQNSAADLAADGDRRSEEQKKEVSRASAEGSFLSEGFSFFLYLLAFLSERLVLLEEGEQRRLYRDRVERDKESERALWEQRAEEGRRLTRWIWISPSFGRDGQTATGTSFAFPSKSESEQSVFASSRVVRTAATNFLVLAHSEHGKAIQRQLQGGAKSGVRGRDGEVAAVEGREGVERKVEKETEEEKQLRETRNLTELEC